MPRLLRRLLLDLRQQLLGELPLAVGVELLHLVLDGAPVVGLVPVVERSRTRAARPCPRTGAAPRWSGPSPSRPWRRAGSAPSPCRACSPMPPHACSILSTTWAAFFAASNLICHAQCRKLARANSPGAGAGRVVVGGRVHRLRHRVARTCGRRSCPSRPRRRSPGSSGSPRRAGPRPRALARRLALADVDRAHRQAVPHRRGADQEPRVHRFVVGGRRRRPRGRRSARPGSRRRRPRAGRTGCRAGPSASQAPGSALTSSPSITNTDRSS